MAKESPLAKALKLAKSKHKNNVAIQDLVRNFETNFRIFEFRNKQESFDLLAGYVKALEGEEGYSLVIGRDTLESMFASPMRRLVDLACMQTRAECLIMALQALGEEIDY